MEFLRKIQDTQAKYFTKGGPLERLYPLYEANDTFLFTPGEVTHGPSHVRDGIDLKRMMITVVVALLPCVLFAMYNTGYQTAHAVGMGAEPWMGWQTVVWEWLGLGYNENNVAQCIAYGALYWIPIFAVTGIVGGHIEVIFALVRGHEINEGFLVTWFLFSLIVPATIPLWQVALGIAFGVLIGKEVFGGTGMNIFNVALMARAFLFFAYPAEISGDMVWTAAVADGATVDGWSGATWLARAAQDGAAVFGTQDNLWLEAFVGRIPGSIGETSALCCLLGAIALVVTKIASWRTMAGVVVGTVVTALLLNVIGSDTNPMFSVNPAWHMVLGGWAFGMVFMATDPVTSAFTDTGKLLYGVGIGFMVILVRVINPAYPEGMMLAILFMNMFAPLIDHYVVQANIKRRKARYGAEA